MNIKEFIDKLSAIQNKHGNDVDVLYESGSDWIEVGDVYYREFELYDEPTKMVILG